MQPEIKRDTRIKWRLSPLRNYPAQSFAARKKRGGGAICERINGTVAGGSRNAATLKKHKISADSLMFQNDLQLGLLDLLIR